jgi:methylated-DNA-protein-cysteine methyltransferase-like protein
MSALYEDIYAMVKRIPKGRVMSYSGVARQIGRPGLQRVVGYALSALPPNHDVPWWRVVNSQGRISNNKTPLAPHVQRDHLLAEGVEVSDDFRLDMRLYDAELNH